MVRQEFDQGEPFTGTCRFAPEALHQVHVQGKRRQGARLVRSCMRATIGVTAGDPAGIGLEVVLKSISSVLPLARWLLFTDRTIFERDVARFSLGIEHSWIEHNSELTDDPVLFVRDMAGDTSGIEWGQRSTQAGDRK